MTLAAGLLLALVSSFALNWGWLAQHGAARELPPLSLRAPIRSLRSLFGDLRWLLGWLAGIGGWVIYVAALALAPLSLVQATSAGGIGILAALVHRRGDGVTRQHWAAVGVAVAGLVLLAVSLAGGTTNAHGVRPGSVGVWLGGAAVLAAVAAVRRTGAALGIAAGVMYAAGDVATKAGTFGGWWFVLFGVMLAAHGTAFVLIQFGFQRGGALATAGTTTLLTNALPIVAGVWLFNEHLPGGGAGVLRVVSFALLVVAAAALARSGGGEEGDRMGGQALPAAGEPEVVGRGRANVDLAAAESLR